MIKRWRVSWWDRRIWKTEHRYFDRPQNAVRCYLKVSKLEFSVPSLAPRLHDPEKIKGEKYASMKGRRFGIRIGGIINRYKRKGKDFDFWGVPASEWLKIMRGEKETVETMKLH